MNRPKVNSWATFFFTLNVLGCLAFFAWAIVDGWFPSEKVLLKHPDPSDPFYLFNQTLAFAMVPITLIAAVPAWVLIKKKKAPWVWTTVLVYISMGILNNPLIYILLLVFWIKQPNKEYYGHYTKPQPPLSPSG